MLHVLLLFAVGLLAGFINVMAGGGSSLTLPALIFLGLDGATANGTNRIAILVQNIFAMTAFEQNKRNEIKESFKLALLTLPGAIIGAFVAISIQDIWFKRILSVVIIFVIISLFLPRPTAEKLNRQTQKKWALYISLFAAGFYGGFIQVGVGFILMAILFHLARFDLVRVNVYKVFIIFLYTLPALLIFILSGKINWIWGLILSAGNGLGGWIGAQISSQKGDKVVRIVLILVLLLMAIKLLNLF
jgi:uncharacterized membrane protein YfcA